MSLGEHRTDLRGSCGLEELDYVENPTLLTDDVACPAPHDFVGEASEGGVDIFRRNVAKSGDTELGCGLQAVAPAIGVRRIAEGVLDPGVNHQQRQPGRLEVEGDLTYRQAARVDEQDVTRLAPQRGGLVHDAGRHSDVFVLGPLRYAGQIPQRDRDVIQVAKSQSD